MNNPIAVITGAPVVSSLLSFFSAYQTAYQEAVALVGLQTLGPPTWTQVDIPDTQPKNFVIMYLPAQVSTSLLDVGATGVPAQVGPVPSIASPLYLDVTLASSPNAVPQRVAYTAIARQTIDQTAVGFHVNEFGLAPGRLEIDAVIVYRGVEYAQVDTFFQFLRQVKTVNPLRQVTPPGEVLFFDMYLQRRLSITIETIMIEEVAGSNNQAHLTMSASILRDWSDPTAANVSQSGFPPSAANLEQAAGLLGGALNFLGVSLP
jgi:hypothetical protein